VLCPGPVSPPPHPIQPNQPRRTHWQDPALQEATASEPLSLQEEYEMQQRCVCACVWDGSGPGGLRGPGQALSTLQVKGRAEREAQVPCLPSSPNPLQWHINMWLVLLTGGQRTQTSARSSSSTGQRQTRPARGAVEAAAWPVR
jgi:hypothetical protein